MNEAVKKRYILIDDLKNIFYDEKEKHIIQGKDVENMLNAYNTILEQTEAIKLKMNDSWLLKKFIKK